MFYYEEYQKRAELEDSIKSVMSGINMIQRDLCEIYSNCWGSKTSDIFSKFSNTGFKDDMKYLDEIDREMASMLLNLKNSN